MDRLVRQRDDLFNVGYVVILFIRMWWLPVALLADVPMQQQTRTANMQPVAGVGGRVPRCETFGDGLRRGLVVG